jgi:alpha-tubulin suppressor-like RCC1 family protein
VDLNSNDRNCGACGKSCGSVEHCIEGQCRAAITAISAGMDQSCALMEDGSVICFGGGVAPGTPWLATARKAALPTKAKSVSAALGHACALLDNGEVWCWGNNSARELGDGTTDPRYEPVKAKIGSDESVRYMSANFGSTCVITLSGKVWCWGSNNDATEINGVPSTAEVVFPGVVHHCVRLSRAAGAKIYCWGSNNRAELALPESGQILPPREIQSLSAPPTNVELGTSMALSYGMNCALVAGGDVKCWGTFGPGGNHEPTTQYVGTPLRALGTLGLAGGSYACALTEAGAVGCFDPSYGFRISVPSGVERFSSGHSHTFGMLKSGRILSWGEPAYHPKLGRSEQVAYPVSCCAELGSVN